MHTPTGPAGSVKPRENVIRYPALALSGEIHSSLA